MSLPVEPMPKPVELLDDTDRYDSGLRPNLTSAWKKELANATTSATHLLEKLGLAHYQEKINEQTEFKCLVTDNYLNKIRPGDINDPLLRQVLPLNTENDLVIQKNGINDPVDDITALATPGLIHKYHGRALLISTGACAIHCRYCFRRHYPYQQSSCTSNSLDDALEYLTRHTEIEEIILSGGDPLVMDNDKLARLVGQLETVTHIQTLRIHTRLPVVLPSRINTGLIELLQSSRFQVVMVIHTNHANELQDDECEKLHLLDKSGITLLNQTVLLKGVNDTDDALVALSKRLFRCKTLPYYLHLLDPVKGAMHFDIDKKTALKLKHQMEIKLPGYLVPKLVQEIAGNESKTAIFRI